MITLAHNTGNRRGITQPQRSAIVAAWGHKCAYCKEASGPFEVDHIVPFADGGTCDLENLCLACVKCNGAKSDTRLPKLYEGLLIAIAVRKAERIRKAIRNRPAQIRRGPVATVKKSLSEATRQLNQSGLRVLEALLSSGLTEEREDRGHLPPRVKCKSDTLQGPFFSGFGLTKHDACRSLASLLLEYEDQGTSVGESLNFSCTSIANTDLHVFSFGKSLSELNLFTSRIKQQMEVAA